MYSEVDAYVTGEPADNPVSQEGEETEDEEFADWRALSLMFLWEYWDSEEDAAYDSL